jgi:hypothetical protein
MESMGSNLLMVRSASAISGGVRMGFGTKPTLTLKDAEAIEKNVTRLKPLGVIAETVENAGINVQARSLVNGNSGRAVICLTLPESNTAVTMSSEKEFQIFSYNGCYNTGFSGIRDAVRIGTAHSADEAAEKLLFGKIGSTVLAA